MKLTKHMIQIGAMKYFRGNAHLVNLGTLGVKRDPIGPKAYIDPERSLDQDKIEAYVKERNYAIGIDFKKFSKTNVEVNGKVKVHGVKLKGATSYTYSKLKTAKLSLLNLNLDRDQLKRLINSDRTAFNYMKNEGSDARAVSEVWIVADAKLAEAIDAHGALNVSSIFLRNDELNVKLKLKNKKTHTITINKGSVFAYKLHKIQSFNKRRKKATLITALKSDSKGMG